MSVLSHLKPESVWKHFEAICERPHPSGHEEAVAQYIEEQADRLGLAHKRDAVGNVVVYQPATPGCEAAPAVVLQGHIDMVCVSAPGVEHDFMTRGIRPRVDGDYVRATGTTLGADNGIGAAFMLAVMDGAVAEHPALEHLFTIDEEDGMTGAHGLDPELLSGRRLINLDTEEFGQIYVSCAGGGDSLLRLPVAREEATGTVLTISASGLRGGHSGADIHLGRGNANRVLARVLAAVGAHTPLRLASLSGGSKRNAIADRAAAVVVVASAEGVDEVAQSVARSVREELGAADPGLAVGVGPGHADVALTLAATARCLDLLLALPHGVQAMSQDIEGLVETSTNMGLVDLDDDRLRVAMMSRSAKDPALFALLEHIRAIARLAGASVEEPLGYPGWKPDMESPLLAVARRVYGDVRGSEPQVKAIHAGLECGLFARKLPGVDMISIGPTMAHVHSPAEEIYIPHVASFFELLQRLLADLGRS